MAGLFYLIAVSKIELAVLQNFLHLRRRLVLELVITDDKEVDPLLPLKLQHLEQVAAEESRESDDIIVKVEAADRVRKG